MLRALRDAIVGGRLAAGAALPPTRRLALTLGLARNTVLLVYEQLAAEGFIRARRGAGSYVEAATALPGREARAAPTARPPRLASYARRLRVDGDHAEHATRMRFDLGSGVAAVAPALQDAWRRALIRAADDTAFDYPPAAGLLELRMALAGYLARRRGIRAEAADILIVTGIQQGIDLCARLLLDPGDVAVVEEPGYGGLRDTLRAHGAQVQLVDVDADGLPPAALCGGPEAPEPKRRAGARRSRSRVRVVAVTPSHQFPTGAELPLARRMALLEWAEREDAHVLEDDYDGEFRHGGRPLPALKSLDQNGRVIYLGSLSRVLFPAVRLGYLVVPPALRQHFIQAKALADRGSPAIEQRALADLISGGRFERLLLATAKRLDVRRMALIDAIREFFGDDVVISGGTAGMHLCLHLPRLPASAESALVAAAALADVRVEGISRYCERPPRELKLLLSYALLSPEDLHEAVRRLAGAAGSL